MVIRSSLYSILACRNRKARIMVALQQAALFVAAHKKTARVAPDCRLLANLFKPCSVSRWSQAGHPSSNHLSQLSLLRRWFNSPGGAPLPKFGLLACGVYPFQTVRFQTVSSLWHFSGITLHSRSLSSFRRRYRRSGTRAYWARRNHYRHRSLCGHGLSSPCIHKARLLKIYKLSFYTLKAANASLN